MAEFEIDGARFRSARLTPKLQMRMLKRLARVAPALKGAGAVVDRLKEGARPSIDEMADALTPVITAFADMPDEDIDYILETAQEYAYEFIPNNQDWRKVRKDGVVLNNHNEELVRSVAIAFYVLRDNFEGMFRSLTASAPAEPAATRTHTVAFE